MELKKIGVGSAAKVGGLLGVVLGLVIGIFAALLSSFIPDTGAGLPFFSGFAAIIILPIVYGIISFIAYAIGAWLYNLVAGWVGGVQLEFNQKSSTE